MCLFYKLNITLFIVNYLFLEGLTYLIIFYAVLKIFSIIFILLSYYDAIIVFSLWMKSV